MVIPLKICCTGLEVHFLPKPIASGNQVPHYSPKFQYHFILSAFVKTVYIFSCDVLHHTFSTHQILFILLKLNKEVYSSSPSNDLDWDLSFHTSDGLLPILAVLCTSYFKHTLFSLTYTVSVSVFLKTTTVPFQSAIHLMQGLVSYKVFKLWKESLNLVDSQGMATWLW